MAHLYRLLLLAFTGLMFINAVAAHSQGLERRPCVAPDSPSGCASMPGAPMPPGAAPNPDRLRPPRTAGVQLNRTPEPPPKPVNPEGAVTLQPGGTEAAPPQPQPEAVGPP